MSHIDPLIDQAARIMTMAGWRITSIIRPGSRSHASGIAVDAAPWVYSPGKVGKFTAVGSATLLYNQLASKNPGRGLIVVAEPTHLHIEVAPDGQWRVGVLTEGPNRPLEVFPMKAISGGRFILDEADIVRSPEGLGDRAFGDPDFEEDDIDGEDGELDMSAYRSVEMMDADIDEADDIDDDEAGDYDDGEIGAARRSRRRMARKAKRQKRRQARFARRMGIKPQRALAPSAPSSAQVSRDLALMSSVAPATTQALLNAAKANSKPAGAGFPWVYPDTRGVTYDGGTLSAYRRLRPIDALTVLTAAYGTAKFTFVSFPFTAVGPNLVLNVDTALAAVLPLGTAFAWVGDGIYITSLALSTQLDAPFTVTRTLAAGVTASSTFRTSEKVKGATLFHVNGQLYADEAGPFIAPVTVAAVPSGNNVISIAGLNVANYQAVLRFILPGDASVAHIIRALELTAKA